VKWRAQGQPCESSPEGAAEEAGFARRRAEAEPRHYEAPGERRLPLRQHGGAEHSPGTKGVL